MTATGPEIGPLEADLVDFATRFALDAVPPEAIAAAKARLLDTVGVAMAAFLAPPARIARRLAQPTAGTRRARVWGTATMTTPELAAFANGVMVRYLDLNDAYRTRDAHHPSDYVPGLLAVAESAHAPGRAFLEAVIVAYEIMCRFTDAVPFNDRGWDQPVTGAMATALGAGRLLALDREAMAHALALAAIPNLCTYQTRAGELSMWKGCAGPNGARNGVFAALLAAEGMSGPYHAFDGVFGLWNQTMGGVGFTLALPDPGGHPGPWGIQQTNIKRFPVRDSCQLPILTALALREALAGRPVESLRIETYRSAWEGAVRDPELWAPKTRETADHSMLFTTACALLDGDVDADSFERERFRDPDVLGLIGRTDVEVSQEFSGATPAVRNCRMTARTGGEEVTVQRTVTLVEIERGLPLDEILAKFRRNTRRVFDPARQDAVIGAVEAIDGEADIARLSRLLEL